MLERAALESASAVVVGNGGGSDCFATVLVREWLLAMGVRRVTVGGVACQWWPESARGAATEHIVGPELYDPTSLRPVSALGENCAMVSGTTTDAHGRRPHEASLAAHVGQQVFVLSHLNGVMGAADGLARLIDSVAGDLVIAVDVGSDSLSSGREVRPASTSLVDHITLSALVKQTPTTYFAIAGLGADAELTAEEVEQNLGTVIRAGGLRGTIAPYPAAIRLLADLLESHPDPVGQLLPRAATAQFGLHHVPKNTPWGEVARLTAASVPVWVLDPQTVIRSVASDADRLMETDSIAAAEEVYTACGRLPETRIARTVDFARRFAPHRSG